MNDIIEGHTYRRYDGELRHLHRIVLDMGELIVIQISDALRAFHSPSAELIQQIKTREIDVDRMEVEADAEISRLIARYSPVGSDLRVVISVSKSVTDLEGIGDEAVRIACVVDELIGIPLSKMQTPVMEEIEGLGQLAISSISDAVGLFDLYDEKTALRVIDNHREMDGEFQSELRRLMSYIRDDSTDINLALNMALVAKSLERITHHAQNLAEYSIFEMEGIDLREGQYKP